MSLRPTVVSVIVSLTGFLAVAAGCDKTNDAPSDPKPTEATEAEVRGDESEQKDESEEVSAAGAAVAEDTPFGDYDLGAIAEKWQGNWVVPGSSLGSVVAWKVDGARVTVFDGESEKTVDLHIDAPCRLAITQKKDGSSSSTIKTFAVADSTIFAGLGSAGVVSDTGAVVCTGGKVYELTDNGCAEWKERFGKWEKTGAECSFEGDTFRAGAKTLETLDGALVDTQMKRNKVRRFAGFDEAKAALQPKAAAEDDK